MEIKILMLAPLSSIHTIRWANALYDRGIKIILAGATTYDPTLYNEGIRIISLQLPASQTGRNAKAVGKLSYLSLVNKVKQLIKEEKIDIIHAHFASSYGLIGALVGFKPFVLSVWGSDVYDFPIKSLLHRYILKFNLSKATLVLSTSHVMADETRRYTQKGIDITPFGVDTNVFKPEYDQKADSKGFVIGIAKTLEEKYGVEYLLRGYAKFREVYANQNSDIQLKIAGEGILKESLVKLADELGIAGHTTFLGKLKHSDIVGFYNSLNIAVFPSILDSESFGVAVIEANACGIPVIVSDVAGFKEVVMHEKNGIIVERKNADAIYEAIERLYLDKTIREKMGNFGRELVKEKYEWNKNVEYVISIYNNILKYHE
ncbi:glycosyltransferase [Chitinophaga japonensis]|uniref:Glycosyltransferase involved in cell wall biosynthesis n=1 Tax=Chitinophaga japonensis TaxID=104662 RepID=A0A562TEV2_CHIJA|nr:glycosyltransferase [Chitinophaga japonensis]TWI92059.1 glycosyltransferase involved in cell wall biosynthesis [Chitinophaga japonensis]